MTTAVVVLMNIGLVLMAASNGLHGRDMRRARREQGSAAWREEREQRPAPVGLQPHDQPRVRVEQSPRTKWLLRASVVSFAIAIAIMLFG